MKEEIDSLKTPDPEYLILVGFGKYDLSEVLSWRDSVKELDALNASTKWPPRYRPYRLCSEEDISLFLEYGQWISSIGHRDYLAL